MDNEENKQQKLTDEEVWLRAYYAGMANQDSGNRFWKDDADQCLKDFKERFRND